MSTQLREKRVLITGAASGIGRCFAETLAGGHTALALVDVSEDALGEVAAGASVGGARAVTRIADVGDPNAVASAVESLTDELGGIDWVVHCAGVLGPGSFAEQAAGEFDRVVGIDLLGTANVARACFGPLRDSRGALACMASTAALHGWPEMSAYSAAKFGVSGFCDAVRPEFSRVGICVTAVYPLLIDTPLLGGADRAPILKQGKAISPRRVVDKTLSALSKRKTRVYVPGYVRAIAAVHGLAPGLLDRYGRRFGLRHGSD